MVYICIHHYNIIDNYSKNKPGNDIELKDQTKGGALPR